MANRTPEETRGAEISRCGVFTRAIMALFGKRPDPVLTHREAAEAFLAGKETDR
jgi:hypothetical protein